MIPVAVIPLLEQLSRDPEDVGVRAVIADMLVEAGDARGEFISLMLRNAHPWSGLVRKRLAKLFDRHRASWLGALATVLIRPDAPLRTVHERDALQVLEGGTYSSALRNARFDVSESEHGEHDEEQWDRGFPVRLACRLEGTTVGAPEWLTVRVLGLAPSASRASPTELAHPSTANLRTVFPLEDDRWRDQLWRYLKDIGRESLMP